MVLCIPPPKTASADSPPRSSPQYHMQLYNNCSSNMEPHLTCAQLPHWACLDNGKVGSFPSMALPSEPAMVQLKDSPRSSQREMTSDGLLAMAAPNP